MKPLEPSYYVRHPDETYTLADPQPTVYALTPAPAQGAEEFAQANGFGDGIAQHYPPALRVMSRENAYTLASKYAARVAAQKDSEIARLKRALTELPDLHDKWVEHNDLSHEEVQDRMRIFVRAALADGGGR